MSARLGNVLYWAACIAAAGWLGVCVSLVLSMREPDWNLFWILGPVPSAGTWAIGRAARYVLSGG